MKRQKRNPHQRAFSKGYLSGYQGRSWGACPYQSTSDHARQWQKGWQEGHDDHCDGISPLASQQKIMALR